MKKITIMSLAGGQGKTTIAHNLALSLSAYGRVLAIDTDPQANFSLYLGAKPAEDDATCLEMLQDDCTAEDCLYKYDLPGAPQRDNLYIIPADNGLDTAQAYLTGSGIALMVLKQRIETISHMFDFAVIDSPPARSSITLTAMGASDLIIIPAEATTKGVGSLIRTLELIDVTSAFLKSKIVGVVPFRDKWIGHTQTKKCKAAIDYMYSICDERGIQLLPSVLESEQYCKALGAGKLVTEIGHSNLFLPFQKLLELLDVTVNEEAA